MTGKMDVTITNEPFIEMAKEYANKWELPQSDVFNFMLELIVCGFEFDSMLFENTLNSMCVSLDMKLRHKLPPF